MTRRRLRGRRGSHRFRIPGEHRPDRDDSQPRLDVRVGETVLPNPVMTASGTAGHGAELGAYVPLDRLGAVVVKSLGAEPWPGNAAPRLHEAGTGMLNSVGLQGPGVPAWLASDLPALRRAGARVVVSIWGRTVEEFEKASAMLAGEGDDTIVAIEVNLSCPNLSGGAHLFAQSASETRDVIGSVVATSGGRPAWAKLTAHVTDLVEIASAAANAGAAAVTVTNTLLGMAIDVDTRTYRLGSGPNGGGMSGAAIHPIAVRAVHDVHAALPDLPVVGVGGVTTTNDAVELMLAGASAVQVGSATFADPRAPLTVLEGLEDWCLSHQIDRVTDLIGGVHG